MKVAGIVDASLAEAAIIEFTLPDVDPDTACTGVPFTKVVPDTFFTEAYTCCACTSIEVGSTQSIPVAVDVKS